MGWSGNATIGFKAAGNYYENHIFSGNSARLIACLNSSSDYSWSNIIYPLTSKSNTKEAYQAIAHMSTLYVFNRSKGSPIFHSWKYFWSDEDIFPISGRYFI